MDGTDSLSLSFFVIVPNSSAGEEGSCSRTSEQLVQPQSVLSGQDACRHSVPIRLPNSLLGDSLFDDEPATESRALRHALGHHHLPFIGCSRDWAFGGRCVQHSSGRIRGSGRLHSVPALLRLLCQSERNPTLHDVDRLH